MVLGNAMMIEGFTKKFAEEIKCDENIDVYLTGEYAETLSSVCSHTMPHFPNLTMI